MPHTKLAGSTLLLYAFAATACSSTPVDVAPGNGADVDAGAISSDAASVSDVGSSAVDSGSDAIAPSDASGGGLAPCMTSGKGGIHAVGPCFVFTAVAAGADPSGVNTTDNEYALEPMGTDVGALVVQLNGSKGTPAGQIAGLDKNIYNAAASRGLHVIGLAYQSDSIIGVSCKGAPGCFGPTREAIALGKYVTGAHASLVNIRTDEGIVERLEAALRLMAKNRPGAGWDAFLVNAGDPDVTKHIAWSKVIASGHSQGGGHAAYLGRLFSLRRVVQLSSTCDEVDGVPAPWTNASEPWATSPATSFIGFGAPTSFTGTTPSGGDTLCPYHAAVWQNMGMSPQREHDDAATCGASGNTHGASITCEDNYARWQSFFD